MTNNYDENDNFKNYYPDDNRRAQRARTPLKPLLIGTTCVALLVFAALAWYGYSKVAVTKTEGGLPVVEADSSMSKTKPTDPGGMDIPHQDTLVYNRMDKNAKAEDVEQLLPTPEKPVEITEDAPAAAPPQTAETATPAETTPAADAKPPVTAAETPVAKPAPVTPTPAPTTTAADQKPVAPVTEMATAGGDAAFNIQLAAVKEQDKASAEWKKMQSKNGDVLGTLNPQYVKADVGDKGTFFRVQAGPMTRAAAAAVCDKLKTRQQPCMVVKSR